MNAITTQADTLLSALAHTGNCSWQLLDGVLICPRPPNRPARACQYNGRKRAWKRGEWDGETARVKAKGQKGNFDQPYLQCSAHIFCCMHIGADVMYLWSCYLFTTRLIISFRLSTMLQRSQNSAVISMSGMSLWEIKMMTQVIRENSQGALWRKFHIFHFYLRVYSASRISLHIRLTFAALIKTSSSPLRSSHLFTLKC